MNEKISGIYCIENLVNNKKYIGYTRNLKTRWKSHKSKLKQNRHGNKYLQNSWNKYGEENFKYYYIQILEEDKEILRLMEIYWICYFNSFYSDGGGYNLTRGGDGCFGLIEESRKKISKSLLGVSSGDKNPNYGKPMPEERKKKLSESLKIFYLTNLPHNYGKSPNKETREKISNSLKGRNLGICRDEKTMQKVSDSQIGTKKNIVSTSEYIGVSLNKDTKKWVSNIRYEKKQIRLGTFQYELEAALAYNDAAQEFYGYKAKLNNISQEEIDQLWNQE